MPTLSAWPLTVPRWRLPANVDRCVLLAALLHLWVVLLVGNVPAGSAAPGEGVFGSLNVRLQGAGRDSSATAPVVNVPPLPQPQGGPAGVATETRVGGSVREATAPTPASREPGAAQLGDWAPSAPTKSADLLPAAQAPALTPALPDLPTLPIGPLPLPGQVVQTRPELAAVPALSAPLVPLARSQTAALAAPAPAPLEAPALLPMTQALKAAPTPSAPTQSAALPGSSRAPLLPPANLPTAASLPTPLAPAAVLATAPRLAAPVQRSEALPATAEAAPAPAVPSAAALAAPLPGIETLKPLPETNPSVAPTAPTATATALPEPTPQPTPQSTPPPTVQTTRPAERTESPATPSGLPSATRPAVSAPTTSGSGRGAPDAGARVGVDVATPPSVPASAPRLNLDLPRPRPGELSSQSGRGVLSLLPRVPETKSKLATEIEKAGKADCRTAYSGLGPLAVLPLAVDALKKDGGCKW